MDKQTATTVKFLNSWNFSVEEICKLTGLSPAIVVSLFAMKVK